ncbi:MAG: iron-containing alcohol dehydrogenase, partial [Candidatus Omnitrophica bacterium]|nr:iron-containing alcohol dehydrogenase [Candidatus Omnitrophota bacterium]
MKKIIISLKKEKYPVYLDCHLSKLGYLIKQHNCGGKVLVVTDENAGKLFSQIVVNSLKAAGNKVKVLTVKPGESSKTFNVAYNLLKECSLYRMERTDVIVALGGGVICD